MSVHTSSTVQECKCKAPEEEQEVCIATAHPGVPQHRDRARKAEALLPASPAPSPLGSHSDGSHLRSTHPHARKALQPLAMDS